MAEIRKKVVIKEKESAYVPADKLHATLCWKKAVDLDLYAVYKTKGGKTGKVYYASMGSLNNFPNMKLDQDSGVGDTGGDNEENLHFGDISEHEHILIVANIYGKSNANFASYDGRVTLFNDTQEFEIPLSAKDGGNWCVVGHIDNTDLVGPKLNNVNVSTSKCPSVDSFLSGSMGKSTEKKGFLSGLFS